MRISINTANTQSQVISVLRFPLVVLILFIHSNFHDISGQSIQLELVHSCHLWAMYLTSFLIH